MEAPAYRIYILLIFLVSTSLPGQGIGKMPSALEINGPAVGNNTPGVYMGARSYNVRRSRAPLRIALGALAVGCVVFGLILDNEVKKAVDEANESREAYLSARDPDLYGKMSSVYETRIEEASNRAGQRNLFYIGSGVGVAALALTFVF